MRQLVAPAALGFLVVAFSAGGALGQVASERFVVSGVIVLEGGGGLAWITEPSLTGGRSVAVRPNESIGPYRVTKILDDRVEFDGPAGTVLVPIYNAQASAAAAAVQSAPGRVPAGQSAVATQHQDAPIAASPAGRPQPDASTLSSLRERLDAAKRLATQPTADRRAGVQPPAVQPSVAPGNHDDGNATAAAPGPQAPAAQDSRLPSGKPRVGSNNIIPAPTSTAPPGASQEVVYPVKGQTFQGILGLK